MTMKRYQPLNRQSHGRTRFGPTTDYRFAAELTLVPIILDEFAVVAREYPVIFPDNMSGLPCALVGMRPQTNAYVGNAGQWLANYIPIFIRQHPFALSEAPGAQGDDGKKRYTLCIDQGAEEFKDLEGARIFDSNGAFTPEAVIKGELARKLIERTGITKAVVRVLDDAGLLVKRSIQMRLLNDELRSVQGFKVIDESKLNAMVDEDFIALRNRGVMPYVYAHLLSMANLTQGILAGQKKTGSSDDVHEATDNNEVDLDIYVDEEGDFQLFN